MFFVRQINLRILYHVVFILNMSVLYVCFRRVGSIVLFTIFGVAAGIFCGVLSMLVSLYLINNIQLVSAIHAYGFINGLFVSLMLSVLCGSWLIGGLSFFILRLKVSHD